MHREIYRSISFLKKYALKVLRSILVTVEDMGVKSPLRLPIAFPD